LLGEFRFHARVQVAFNRFLQSPALVRVVPFLLFVALTVLQGSLGEASRYWFYCAKTLLGAVMLAAVWRHIAELRWVISWEAVVAGVLVFAFWVGLEGHYPGAAELLVKLGLGQAPGAADPPWNPHAQFGEGSALAWFFIVTRFAGSVLVVPPLEEVFYRSFLYRYVAARNWTQQPLGRFVAGPFIIVALVFGFAHFEWLPGILCAGIYQGLVCWKGRLGDALTAHAITNALLAAWVVWRGAWQFW
jgi:uncharacterized protein